MTMIETTLYYAAEDLRDWKLGCLHRKWYECDKTTFCELDLKNADGQHCRGFHYGEWFMIRHFREQGYEVLPPKYLHPTRPEARQKAIEILGQAGVAYLMKKRRFGTGLRKSPRPDLLVFKSNPKTFFFVEVKRDTDKLSSAQKQFFPMIEEKLGCEVRIAYLKARLRKEKSQ